MFEKALKQKLRFDFKGKTSVEDLWDLSQTELNEIYTPLKAQLNQAESGTLLGDKPKSLDTVKYKIEILRYIAESKKAEAEKNEKRVQKMQTKAKLLDALEQKENAERAGKTAAEIRAELAALDSED